MAKNFKNNSTDIRCRSEGVPFREIPSHSKNLLIAAERGKSFLMKTGLGVEAHRLTIVCPREAMKDFRAPRSVVIRVRVALRRAAPSSDSYQSE